LTKPAFKESHNRNKNQAFNYNPDWDAGQYESRVSYYELSTNKNNFKLFNVENVYFMNNTFLQLFTI